MDRYRIERRGSPGRWGPSQIIDNLTGRGQPVAVTDDPDMAQKIVDLLNGDDDTQKMDADLRRRAIHRTANDQ